MAERKLAPHPERFCFEDPVFGKPELADDCFVSRSAVMIGHIEVRAKSVIFPLSSIRADEGTDFLIGEGSNIQDHCCLHGHKKRNVTGDDGVERSIDIGRHNTFAHGSKGHGPLKMGNKNFVGLGAILHSCEVGRQNFFKNMANIQEAIIGDDCYFGLSSVVCGVKIKSGSWVKDRQVITKQSVADRLPRVPKELAKLANETNKMIVDENKHLCQEYHRRRLALMEQSRTGSFDRVLVEEFIEIVRRLEPFGIKFGWKLLLEPMQ